MQTLAALLTPTIALFAALIAFLQWRTAHQKVVLDVFDRRLKVYDQVNEAVISFLAGEGNLTPTNARIKLSQAWSESRFLFGQEVTDAIAGLQDDIAKVTYYGRRMESQDISETERNDLIEKIVAIDSKLSESKGPFTDICLPYLRMDQKRVRTPAEWFHHRNALRKSFGDKHQI
ncbi:hypothetical protein [Sinorhizobium fredii]